MPFKSILILLFSFFANGLIHNIPTVNVNQQDRYTLHLQQQKLFKIKKSGYDPNQKYEIRVSYLGSVGAEVIMKWRNAADLETFSAHNPSFRPLDTQHLIADANEQGILEGPPGESLTMIDDEEYYVFFMFMYRNSKGKNKYYNESPMDVYITIIPVLFPGVGVNIIEAHAAPLIAAVVIFMCILPLTIHKIPHFKEFLVRDYDPNKRVE